MVEAHGSDIRASPAVAWGGAGGCCPVCWTLLKECAQSPGVERRVGPQRVWEAGGMGAVNPRLSVSLV